MARTRWWWIGFLGVLALLSIGIAPDRTSAVVNGAAPPDNATTRASLAVYVDYPKPCSGTLITRRIVLTAGHCMPDHPKPDGVESWADTHAGWLDWEVPGRWYEPHYPAGSIYVRVGLDMNAESASRHYVVDKYRIPGNTDMIMFHLKSAGGIPDSVATPVPVLTRFPRNPSTFWNNQSVTLYGYGNPDDSIDKLTTAQANTNGLCDPVTKLHVCINFVAPAYGYPGDSGGSIIWTDSSSGKRWLVGIDKGLSDDGANKPVFNATTFRGGSDSNGIPNPDLLPFIEGKLGPSDIAWARVKAGASPTFTSFSYPTMSGSGAQVTRSGVGRYSVNLPEMKIDDSTVHATAVNGSGASCQAAMTSDVNTTVQCRANNGSRADVDFNLLVDARATDSRASILTTDGTPSVFHGQSPSGQPVTVSKASMGRYTVSFPGVPPLQTAQVTAEFNPFEPSKTFCNVAQINPASVEVSCNQPGNVAVDSSFEISATSFAGDDEVAKRDLFASVVSTSSGWAATHSSTLGTSVQRLSTGMFRLKFGEAPTTQRGAMFVTAVGKPKIRCGALPWAAGHRSVDVNCMDDGALRDSAFTVRWLNPVR